MTNWTPDTLKTITIGHERFEGHNLEIVLVLARGLLLEYTAQVPLVKPGPGVRTVLTGAKPWTLLEARAAAWAYYWRRREVADKLDQPQLVERAMAMPDPRPIWWSRCLAWPDEQVSAVERWLTDGGEMPEVLRA